MMFMIIFCIKVFIIIFSIIAIIWGACTVIGNILTKVPFVNTPLKGIQCVMKYVHLKPEDICIDFGAGNGRVLEAFERQYGVKGIGYELAIVPWLASKIRLNFRGLKSRVYLKNFLHQDISKADCIYCFLTKIVIHRVASKLLHECKKGAYIISYGTPLPSWKEKKIIPSHKSEGQLCEFYIYKKE